MSKASRQKRDDVSVELKTTKKSLNHSSFQQEQSPENLEIERSLYYLGRALYRYSLLQKKGVSDDA